VTSPADHEEPESVSITGGSALLLSARLISNLAAFAAVVVVAHALGPSGRGTVAFVATAGILIGTLSRLGMDQAVVVFAARSPRDRPALLANLLLFSVAASVAAACVVALVLVLGGLHPAGVDAFDSWMIVLGSLGSALAGAAGSYLLGCRWHLAQAVTIACPAIVLCVLVVYTWGAYGLDVRKAVVASVAGQIAGAAVGVALCLRVAGVARPDRELFSETAGFSMRAWFSNIAWYLNARTDQFIMGFLASGSALGIYVVAVNVSEVLLQAPSAVSRILLSAIAGRPPEERRARTLHVLRVLQLLTLGLLVAGLACAPLIPIVFGSAFGDSMVPYLVLLPGMIPYTAMVIISSALIAASQPGRASLSLFAAFVVGLVLDLALIPPFGATGAAVAATAAFAAGGIAAILVYRRTEELRVSELLPRAADVAALRALAVRVWEARRRVLTADGAG
jgi:O-antigen/teichoic acid export membrane protein